MAFNKLVIWSWNRELFWKNVWCSNRKLGVVGNIFEIVFLNGKWLKNLHVFCVNLLY